jgi:hypothetical protein
VEPIAFNQTGPDGVANSAITLQDNGAGGSSGNVYIQDNGISISASTIHTASVFVKAGNNSQIEIETRNDDAVRGGLFDISTETFTPSASETGTIQSVGNGWYRCALTWTSGADTSIGLRVGFPNITRDGTNTIYLYGAQFEAGSTPSSLIPTSGQQGTREAESFTIPSANLPWPTPQIISSELVDNGDFATTSDWSLQSGVSIGGGVLSSDGTSTGELARQSNIGVTSGNLYAISLDVISLTAGKFGVKLGGTTPIYFDTTGSHEALIVATATDNVQIMGLSGTTGSVDNISVREINPLSVSIGMEGRMTYADTDSANEINFVRWLLNASNQILIKLRTNGANEGEVFFRQEENNVTSDVATAGDLYQAGVLLPFDLAQRSGSTLINGAVNGVALTANTTPTALPDLSSSDLELAQTYMGTISEFRVWDKDLGDTGIVEATNPSLEPSLSLTFEGVGTNSFVTNDWSQ